MEQLSTSQQRAVPIPLCPMGGLSLKALGVNDSFWPLTDLMGQDFRICSLVAPYVCWQKYHNS